VAAVAGRQNHALVLHRAFHAADGGGPKQLGRSAVGQLAQLTPGQLTLAQLTTMPVCFAAPALGAGLAQDPLDRCHDGAAAQDEAPAAAQFALALGVQAGARPPALRHGPRPDAAPGVIFWAAVVTEIHLCNVYSCPEILRRHGRVCLHQDYCSLRLRAGAPCCVSLPLRLCCGRECAQSLSTSTSDYCILLQDIYFIETGHTSIAHVVNGALMIALLGSLGTAGYLGVLHAMAGARGLSSGAEHLEGKAAVAFLCAGRLDRDLPM
jgi:hypothetical protein